MLPIVALLAIRQADSKSWYGPATATFQVMFGGNPYDPAVNDVHVKFLGPKGDPIDRIAYFDGESGYKAILVTPIKGRYKATLYRNGQKMIEQPQEGLLDLEAPLPHGFVRLDKTAKNRFRWDDGLPYYPTGFNLGWQNGNFIPMADELTKMGKNGVNWSRIWASSWDGKNPWWPQEPGVPKDQLWPKALNTWEKLVANCEQNGVVFQMVLFNHGLFSSKVNPNWPDHPWNAKNGGFLKDAADFFTDPEAKRRAKMWLRYAVARYGASPSILAWEIFNEVEWVDARYANRWPDIESWHKEMAEYLRSIDPYGHMVTTSSAMDRPALFAPMDYYQAHTYPSNVLNAIAGYEFPADKPGFFGEFGPPGEGKEAVRAGLRDGIYGAMAANQAAAAMYWGWDTVENLDLYGEFKTASTVIVASGIANHPNAKQLHIRVATAGAGDLTFGPGGGWQPMEQSNFNLPDDLTPQKLSKLPGYFQSMEGNHKDLKAGPITLTFRAKQPGKFVVRFNEIASGGAAIRIYVNDKLAKSQNYPAKDKNYAPEGPVSVPFPAGAVSIRMENHGADWAHLTDMTVTNAGPQASGIACGESDWMLLRLTANKGLTGVQGTVNGLSIGDGTYEVITIDLDSGTSSTKTMQVHDFSLQNYVMPGNDVVLAFKRK